MNERYRNWLGQHYVADASMHRLSANLDLDQHLLGNGNIQAVVQVTRDKRARNALVLHLMNPDRFEGRNKSDSFTYHQQLGPEYTFVSLVTNEGIHLANPRQAEVDLRYGLSFDDKGIPIFWATYPLDYTFTSARSRTAFHIAEEMFVPEGEAALLRRVTVTNTRGLAQESAKLFVTLTPNQELFPEAHHVTAGDVSVAGAFGDGDEFLSLSILDSPAKHMVAEFPKPLEAIVDDTFGVGSQDDDDRVQPKASYGNFPVLPSSPHVGAVLAYEIDLGELSEGESRTVDLCYAYGASEQEVVETSSRLRNVGFDDALSASSAPWSGYNHLGFGDQNLDTLFASARSGLHASVASSGRMNAGIWGYNSEWVRDSSLACVGVTLSGQHDIARTMLTRILEGLIDDSGMGFGEARFYTIDEAELDQNGQLLYAVWQYWVHSRDDEFVRQHWDRIRAVAELPLRPEFWVEQAQMVQSTRDTRERDLERHGLEPGFDLGHQTWVTVGLAKAAEMAVMVGDEEPGTRWRERSTAIWESVLTNPEFKLIEDDYFMYRRSLDGVIQRDAKASAYIHWPRFTDPTTHMYPRNLYRKSELEPCSFEAWPIALGLVDPTSALATRSLIRMEQLWNEEWDFGGYGLHNSSSEISKVGPWPMSFYMITQGAVEARNWDTVRRNIDWVMSNADGRGYMWWEYRDANPEFQIDHGIIPWLAYGEAISLLVRNMLGYQPLSDGIEIRPRLLPETTEVSASLRFGSHRVGLVVHNEGPDVVRAVLDGEVVQVGTTEPLKLPVPERDIEIEVWTG
ncbi:MAG: hypothetical protein BMS9Abin12_1318 [Acidimicrobiia bacterium]|nr:MAG: hypothetical protein BMS9Abin12_1318 [Acidimicrobiia bacterium]